MIAQANCADIDLVRLQQHSRSATINTMLKRGRVRPQEGGGGFAVKSDKRQIRTLKSGSPAGKESRPQKSGQPGDSQTRPLLKMDVPHKRNTAGQKSRPNKKRRTNVRGRKR